MPKQIPRDGEIIGPGIDALRAVRPTAAAFVDSGGRYRDLFVGWRAQSRLALQIVADEVASARLYLAKGKALSELTRSEFNTDRVSGSVSAIGSVTLVRPSLTPPAVAPGNAILAGTRFRRDAVPTAIPPVPAAVYRTTRDVPVTAGQTIVTCPIEAVTPGAASNAPVIVDASLSAQPFGTLAFVDQVFDTTFTISSYEAAGGLDAETDADLVAEAHAYALGQYGPTIGAIAAGALRGTGVHRAVVRDVAQYSDTLSAAAFTGVCLVDASWGYGTTWLKAMKQTIAGVDPQQRDAFQGFGGTIMLSGASNLPIRVDCAVTLRASSALAYTESITAAIQAAVRSYFDDRPDWYTWRTQGLQSAIVGADRRILSCSSVTVSAVSNNSTVTQPSATPSALTSIGLSCLHYLLVANGVNVTYSAPT